MCYSSHTYLMPHLRLNRNRVEFGIWLDKPSIHLLAFWAPLDKFPNVIIHVLPVESTADLFYCLVTTKVATCSAKQFNSLLVEAFIYTIAKLYFTYLYGLHSMTQGFSSFHPRFLHISSMVPHLRWHISCSTRFQPQSWNCFCTFPQICFFRILPAQKIFFNFVKLTHSSPTE